MSALQNIEAEAAVLGMMMADNGLIDRIADKLGQQDFAEPIHGHLFSVITTLAGKGQIANPVSVSPHWLSHPAAQELGGNAYLMKLTAQSDAGVFGLNSFVSQLSEMAKRRHIADGLNLAAAMADNHESSIDDIIATADAALAGNEAYEGIEQLTALQFADNLINTFGDPKNGVSCGTIAELDTVLGKIRPKELIILAGRPGMGKTAAALSYALGAAQSGFGTMYVSLEMSGVELSARMLADLAFDGHKGVFYSNIRDGDLTDNQKRSVWKARNMLADMPLKVVDAGKLTTGRLSMLVMRTKRRMEAQGQSLDLVIVDYLQLLSADTPTRGMYEKVSEISMALKAIAKTHGVAIMALAQLSREVEKRTDRVPQLSDLRDSGQIEQDADGVVFLVRQAYYMKQEEPALSDPTYASWLATYEAAKLQIEFIVAKRRNGETGKSEGQFFGQFQAVRGL